MSDPANPIDTAEPTLSTIKRFLCRHIHTSGHRCGSPALRGESFCYFHHTTRRPAPRHRGVHPAQSIFELPPIDDRAGIQFALAQVLARIATDQLDHKRSGRLLHGLFIASRNLPRDPRPAARPASRTASRDSSRDSSRSYVCRSPSSRDSSFPDDSNLNDPDDLVEDIILDSDLGPIAPIAEIPTPEAAAAAAHAAAQARDAKAAAAHAADRAAVAEAIQSAVARFQQENGFSDLPEDPTHPLYPNPSLLSSRSAPLLSSRSAAEGSASPLTNSPQPTQPEAVIPTGAADGSIVRRAVEGPPHSSLLIAQSPQPIAGPQPPATLTPDPLPATLPTLQAVADAAGAAAPQPALGLPKGLDVELWVRRAHLQSTPAIQSVLDRSHRCGSVLCPCSPISRTHARLQSAQPPDRYFPRAERSAVPIPHTAPPPHSPRAAEYIPSPGCR
jgi:hypothetical protein